MVYSFVNNILEIILKYIFELYQNLEIFIYKYDEEYNHYCKTKNYKLLFERFPQIVKNKKWYNKLIDEFINDDILHFIFKAPKNHITREIVLKALNKKTKLIPDLYIFCYEYIPEWFKYDKGIINYVLKRNYKVFNLFPSIVKINWIKEGLKININVIKYINNESFNLDVFNLVKSILIKDINNFEKLSIDLQYDSNVRDFVVEKIINKTKKNKLCQNIINNRPIILNTVKGYPMIIKELNNYLMNDKEIIMEAVKRDGNLYRFVSETLKDDMEIVLTSYLNSKNFYHYYSEKNKEIIDLHYLSV